jgi:hypothetical protein
VPFLPAWRTGKLLQNNMFIASARQEITVTSYNQDIATVGHASCIPLHPYYFTSSETTANKTMEQAE